MGQPSALQIISSKLFNADLYFSCNELARNLMKSKIAVICPHVS